MSDLPRASVTLNDFAGLVTNADPRDLPPGAAEHQVNIQSARAGELTVRPGYRVVTFEEE